MSKEAIIAEISRISGVVSVSAREVLHVRTYIPFDRRYDESLRNKIYEMEKSLLGKYPELSIDFVLSSKGTSA